MKILMVLAPSDFRDEEYLLPREEFEKANADVMTSSVIDIAVGRFGCEEEIDIQLKEAAAENFDAIFWVGGGGCLEYMTNEDARALAGEFFLQKKVTGAICAAPRLLLAWRLLEGKRVTGWNSDNNLEKLAIQGGAIYTGADVEVDGKILTADGPDSAKKAGVEFLKLLEKVQR